MTRRRTEMGASRRRRELMIIAVLHGLEVAGIRPVSGATLHRCIFLSNALAPAWRLEPLETALLKTSRDPFFPEIDGDIAHLVGLGVIEVSKLRVVAVGDTPSWQGHYGLRRVAADRILAALRSIDEEDRLLDFYMDVAQAVARLPEEDDRTMLNEDATYGDPMVETGEVLDIGQWKEATQTATAQVVAYLQHKAPRPLHAGEIVDIYVDHLARRLERA